MSVVAICVVGVCLTLVNKWFLNKEQKVSEFYQKINIEDFTYEKIGYEIKGVKYNQELTRSDIEVMNQELNKLLSHDEACSYTCQEEHNDIVNSMVMEENDCIKVQSSNIGEDNQYVFKLANQKDIHYNTYAQLTITGLDHVENIDNLCEEGRALFKEWKLKTNESIYFAGYINSRLSELEREEIIKNIFKNFKAKRTSYYEDDLSDTTCVYYGYTPEFNEYIKENDNSKTNIQIGFKYNEVLDQTEIIIAFPFYNIPF